jgi:hypothetical protein
MVGDRQGGDRSLALTELPDGLVATDRADNRAGFTLIWGRGMRVRSLSNAPTALSQKLSCLIQGVQSSALNPRELRAFNTIKCTVTVTSQSNCFN